MLPYVDSPIFSDWKKLDNCRIEIDGVDILPQFLNCEVLNDVLTITVKNYNYFFNQRFQINLCNVYHNMNTANYTL